MEAGGALPVVVVDDWLTEDAKNRTLPLRSTEEIFISFSNKSQRAGTALLRKKIIPRRRSYENDDFSAAGRVVNY